MRPASDFPRRRRAVMLKHTLGALLWALTLCAARSACRGLVRRRDAGALSARSWGLVERQASSRAPRDRPVGFWPRLVRIATGICGCGSVWLTLCTYRSVSKRSLSALQSVMATVKVQWVTLADCVGQQAYVCIEVQTSVGGCAFPFSVDDQGSDQANEQQARRELKVFLEEALEALGES